jgi:trans-2-enoyl-CoA reductase
MSNRAVVHTFVDNGLEIVVRPKPIASPGNVVIRLTVRAVNPIDSLIIRENWLRHLADEHHYHPVIGSEGFGHITEVGEGVTKFKVNQRVVPILYWKYYLGKGEGAWQDYVEVAEEDVVHIPDNVSDDAAAQYLINPWTAYGLLSEIGVKEGEYLLQTAAASVIGR